MTRSAKSPAATPPEHFVYELFLDDKGQKISKSKGNGITIEEWLSYGPAESLALFMFQKPRAAKRLHFDVIPKAVDDYIAFLDAYHATADAAQRLENPVWFIHGGEVPEEKYPVSFALMLNLVSASGAHNRDVLWGFIRAYAPDASPERNPGLERLVGYALRYYEDFVKPAKQYRAADAKERAALEDLAGPAGSAGRRARRRRGAECRLRSGQDAWLRAAARLVRRALRSAVRPDRGPALRLFRRPVRLRRDGGA